MRAICGGLAVSFLLFGFWWPYWRIADMDFWMVYEAWLFNDRLPQEWFDHPGYLTILSLGEWFRGLHALNLLDVSALSGVPAPANSEHAWTAATRAGRVLSLLLSTAFVVTFAFLVRRLTANWQVAVLAAFVLAFSGGLAMNARIIRTELLASAFVVTALLVLLIAARTTRTGYRPLLVGLAAFLATLGHINKVQVVFLICALPVVVLPFGRASDDSKRGLHPLHIAAALCAVALAIPAAMLVSSGLSQPMQMPWIVNGVNLGGIYQAAVAVWIVVAVLVFAIVWRVSAAETAATLACVLAGISLALLSLYIRYNPQNVAVVINPLEQLLFWAKSSEAPGSPGLLAQLIQNVGMVAKARTFVLDTTARPTIFLEWLVLAGAVFAWRSGRRLLVLQVMLLIGLGWAMDTLNSTRGLKLQYFILTDPLIILAAAILVAGFEPLRTHRYAFAVGIALLAVHVAISQAEPIKATFSKNKPLEYCVKNFGYTKRIELYSFCPAAADMRTK